MLPPSPPVPPATAFPPPPVSIQKLRLTRAHLYSKTPKITYSSHCSCPLSKLLKFEGGV
ncbi:hypothetical protein GYMLUDRAFT_36423 [Collybiopsis luxurians FD-317 M1]|nr:hypothetical protein GYMLUDRAFT_36423 [Collybiopsis luxurians FD-317 M1]